MLGRPVAHDQIGERRQHIVALELTLNMDRQAFPAVLVDHRQQVMSVNVV